MKLMVFCEILSTQGIEKDHENYDFDLLIQKSVANFIVCNFDDKGCKKSNGYKSMIDALRFTAGYAAAHVSTFYWGRPSHLILC